MIRKEKLLIHFDKREIKLIINLAITVHLSETEKIKEITL